LNFAIDGSDIAVQANRAPLTKPFLMGFRFKSNALVKSWISATRLLTTLPGDTGRAGINYSQLDTQAKNAANWLG
jgi:hypothetical protein